MSGKKRRKRVRKLLRELIELIDPGAEVDVAWLRVARLLHKVHELDHVRRKNPGRYLATLGVA